MWIGVGKDIVSAASEPRGEGHPIRKAVYAQREGFKPTAQTAEGKTSLVGTCTTLLENLKKNPACQ